MSTYKHHGHDPSFFDDNYENPDVLKHKKRVRQMLEDRLERKRLKDELDDEIEGEFDWKDLDY